MKEPVASIVPFYKPTTEMVGALAKAFGKYPVYAVCNSPVGNFSFPQTWNVIHNKTNVGYACGVNMGIRKALEAGAKWLVVCNQDVRFSPGSFEAFVATVEKSEAGVIGPRGGSLDPRRWTTILAGREKQVAYISGSCMAVHRGVIERTGGLWEPYFMYYEDAELGVLATQMRFELNLVSIAGFCHAESASLGPGSDDHHYYLARNHMLFVKRNAPASVKRYEILRLPKTILEHMLKGEWAALEGIRDYAMGHFGPRGRRT